MDRPSATNVTKITVETETLMVVRQAKATRGWCPECRAEVDLITLDDNTLADTSATVHTQDCFVAGKVHFWQTADGPTQICLTSLLRCFESAEAQRVCRCIKNQFDQIRRKK